MKRICIVFLLGVGLVLLCTACAPTLDWREVYPQGSGATLMLPCKPKIEQRGTMGLASCEAGDARFSLSWAELDDPAQVELALARMRAALAGKLNAAPAEPRAVRVPGMTPSVQAVALPLVPASGASTAAQQGQVAVFARGLKVYQLVMLGRKANPAAWETLLDSIHLG